MTNNLFLNLALLLLAQLAGLRAAEPALKAKAKGIPKGQDTLGKLEPKAAH